MPASSLQIREAGLQDLRKLAAEGRLWTILDACDELAVPPKVSELGPERAMSLYRGSAEHEKWDVAPYLARADEKLVEWISETLWTRPWGIFAVSDADLKTLRRHFRRFLTVQEPDGEAVLFRYYDPRILAAFLPACNEEELAAFFGPVKAYAAGNPDSGDAKLFFHLPG